MDRDVEAFVDPRVVRSRRVIREAALAELAEAGYGGFTIESVAARAGVAKSTVYRHWDGKLPLIRDAFEVLNEQPGPDLGDGTPREQVERLLFHLVEVLTDSIFSSCVQALIEAAEHDAAVREFYHAYAARRRQTLTDVIARGIAAGGFPRDLDPELASLALAGAIFYCRLLTPEPLEAERVPKLIDTVLGSPRRARS